MLFGPVGQGYSGICVAVRLSPSRSMVLAGWAATEPAAKHSIARASRLEPHSHTHTHTHTHPHTHSHTHTHTHTHRRTHTLTFTHTLTHTDTSFNHTAHEDPNRVCGLFCEDP
jgi:hypothetical protein